MKTYLTDSGRYRVVVLMLSLCLFLIVSFFQYRSEAEDLSPGRKLARQKTERPDPWITSDHTRHDILNQPFKNGAEVSNACLSCHNEADAQFKETIHWTWKAGDDETGRVPGKGGDSLNNFCISTNRMKDKGCLSCHPGWKTEVKDINCLACHGSKKINWEEAFDDYNYFMEEGDDESLKMAEELQSEIQSAVTSVTLPGRKNCGACHFNGGGGDGVKHGDLDTSLTHPNKELDVHMDYNGQDFACTRCHTTVQHHVAGRVYSRPAAENRKSLIEDDLTAKITCESCHSITPHESGSKLNDHTDKVACQSCHIPEFARINPTKMEWDWSTSGKKKDGREYKEEGPFGKEIYLTKKGDMRWDKNVRPEYYWYNGSIKSVLIQDEIDPGGPVAVSQPVGSMDDPDSRIYPFKVHRSNQPYDVVNKRFLAPLLSGKEGYWTTYDWDDAFTKGMAAFDLPYSGKFDFVKTTYVFPITHMVAPKEKAVSCRECHMHNTGRLAVLSGFYMPGRDNPNILNMIGWLMVLGALGGVSLHGLGRIITGFRKEEQK